MPLEEKEDNGVAANIAEGGDVDRAPGQQRGKLTCPACQSEHVRRSARPFLVNLAAFLSFLLLIWLGVPRLDMCLGFVLCLAGLVSFFALFVTAVLAILGRYRCESCGHKFSARRRSPQGHLTPRFPAWLSLLGAVILFLGLVVGRQIILVLSGVVWWVVAIECVKGAFGWGLLAGALLLCQALLHRFLRRRIRHAAIWAVLFLLPAVILSSMTLYSALRFRPIALQELQPAVRAAKILENARLAALPAGATDINVHEWSSPFSGEEFLRFRASPAEIERFLSESPSLKGKQAEPFQRKPEPSPPAPARKSGWPYDTLWFQSFQAEPGAPEWHRQPIDRGRRYEFRPKGGYLEAGAIVDDDNHLVYVTVVWS
ncbi:MAG: hypothetical protein JW741_12670 [Sedimentisphaerales bacterium]|nr:hypothetical protein [Sedimentisphaerales bacterium]